jgi:hypothetical protein
VVGGLLSLVLLAGAAAVGAANALLGGGSGGGLSDRALGTIPAAYVGLIEQYGRACPGLGPGLFAAQLYQESGFNPREVSSAGAVGIAQFLPENWGTYGGDYNHDGTADPFDPADEIPAAARYDCDLLRQVQNAHLPGDPVNNMLAAYNAGFHRMTLLHTHGVPWPAETQHYVTTIRALEQDFTGPGFTGVGPVAAPSQAAAAALAFARAQLGKPYRWGGDGSPEQGGGFDCSGLTQAAYAAAHIVLPRTSRQQWYAGPHVPASSSSPGTWSSTPTTPPSQPPSTTSPCSSATTRFSTPPIPAP